MTRAVPRLLVVLTLTILSNGPSVQALTIRVPADQPTIQAGLNAASAGDTVLVRCGRYTEHDVVMKSGIVLRSERGEASCAVIDAQSLGRVMYGEDLAATTRIEGFTLKAGLKTGFPAGVGAGAYFVNSSPHVVDCDFVLNVADYDGGGVRCANGAPDFTRCSFRQNRGSTGGGFFGVNCVMAFNECDFRDNVGAHGGGATTAGISTATFVGCNFVHNSTPDVGGGFLCYDLCSLDFDGCTFDMNAGRGAGLYLGNGGARLRNCLMTRNLGSPGGGVYVDNGPATFDHCTFAANQGFGNGAAVFADDSTVDLTNCIAAFNPVGEPLTCSGSSITVSCSDVFGNAAGDWVGCVAPQASTNGNFSADPLFCNPGAADYRLNSASPCVVPQLDPACGDHVGAIGVGCGTASVAEGRVERTHWGLLKHDMR